MERKAYSLDKYAIMIIGKIVCTDSEVDTQGNVAERDLSSHYTLKILHDVHHAKSSDADEVLPGRRHVNWMR